MSKGNRNRELRLDTTANTSEAKLSKLQLVKQQERKEKTKKIIAWLIVALIIVAIIVAIIVSSSAKSANMKKVVAESDNYTIDNSMVAYYMYSEFQNLYSNYGGSTLSTYFGLDTTKSLKAQNPSIYAVYYEGYNSEYTWFQNFVSNAVNRLKEYVALAEEAKSKNIELDDSEKKTVANTIESIKAAAKQNKMSVKSYLSAIYVDGVTLDTVERCLNLQSLASKYATQLTDAYDFSDEDCEKFVLDNKSSFYKLSYIFYEFNADYDKDADEETVNAAKAKAKADAEKFLEGITDEESMLEAIYLNETLKEKLEKEEKESETTESGNEDESTEAKEKTKEDYTDGFVVDDKAYNDDFEWAWDIEAGQTKLIEEDDGCCVVYFIKEAVHRDTDLTRDVRHILIMSETVADDEEKTAQNKEEAKKKAEEILNKYLENPTADNFAALANEYSEDPGSNTKGGIYEKVAKGQMVVNFNDWLFGLGEYADVERKPGDTGIVESDYGWHVMYYVGENDEVWKSNALDGLKSEKYSTDIKTIKSAHPLAFDENSVMQITSR